MIISFPKLINFEEGKNVIYTITFLNMYYQVIAKYEITKANVKP